MYLRSLTLFLADMNIDIDIEVASVIDRKGLARAGSWFMTEG